MKVTLACCVLALLWSLTILGAHTLPEQDTDTEISNLKNEVTQLKQDLASLQTQSHTQDQKYAAILSSVLSSIRLLKDANNSTNIELATVKTHLSNVENDHNSTAGNTTLNLSELSSLMTVLDGLDVCFEALLEKGFMIKEKDNIIFDNVTLNQGEGYDPLSGVFTAPVPGTYMFWAHVLLHVHDNHNKALNVDIYTSRGLLSRGYAKVTADLTYNAATPTVAALLDKGEQVWFQVIAKDTASIVGDKATSCGGTLLHVKQFV